MVETQISGKNTKRKKVIQWGRPGVSTVQIGGGPRIAVPVWGITGPEIAEAWKAAAESGADIVEWRIDGIMDPQLETFGLKLRELYRVPVLVTLRSKPEGGRFPRRDSSDSEYRRLILQAAHWADAVDIEIDFPQSSELVKQVKDLGAAVVLSKHQLTDDPTAEAIKAELQRMVDAGADVAKIAWVTTTDEQVQTIEATQKWAENNLPIPAVIIGIGEIGSGTRIGENAARSAFTFAVASAASAPGQLSVQQVKDTF